MAERFPGVREGLRSRLSEGRAIALQAKLMLAAARREEPRVVGARAVVMVHGYLAAAPVWDPLRVRIAEEHALPSMSFGYGSHRGFEETAERLALAIEEHVPSDARITLLGHSLGGILARWYAQELGGASRVDRIVTVSSPHRGTPVAERAPFGLGAAIRPGSDALERLGPGDGEPPIHAIGGVLDRTVPLESALGCNAESMRAVPGVGHNTILYDERGQRAILDALSPSAPGSGGVAGPEDKRRSSAA